MLDLISPSINFVRIYNENLVSKYCSDNYRMPIISDLFRINCMSYRKYFSLKKLHYIFIFEVWKNDVLNHIYLYIKVLII